MKITPETVEDCRALLARKAREGLERCSPSSFSSDERWPVILLLAQLGRMNEAWEAIRLERSLRRKVELIQRIVDIHQERHHPEGARGDWKTLEVLLDLKMFSAARVWARACRSTAAQCFYRIYRKTHEEQDLNSIRRAIRRRRWHEAEEALEDCITLLQITRSPEDADFLEKLLKRLEGSSFVPLRIKGYFTLEQITGRTEFGLAARRLANDEHADLEDRAVAWKMIGKLWKIPAERQIARRLRARRRRERINASRHSPAELLELAEETLNARYLDEAVDLTLGLSDIGDRLSRISSVLKTLDRLERAAARK